MIVVRRCLTSVVVVAMLHIPEVSVRRVLVRSVDMARTGRIVVITVVGGVDVIRVIRVIEVIGMLVVDVIGEREIAMCVVVIAMVEVRVSVSVLMRRPI